MVRNYLLLILGIAVVSMIGGIIAFRKIKFANTVISQQKELVEEKQKEILDSINYARRIQYALLTSDQLLRKYLPDYFVLFRPKDVVSGDFYWGTPTGDGFLYITGDCTGHGVPGAFIILLNITKLNEVVNEHRITRPDLVLNKVREEIISVLNPDGSEQQSSDGMDAILCSIDPGKMLLRFAAANNALYIVRQRKLITFRPDKMPVGKGHDDMVPFTLNEIKLEKGDTIYTLTDGFADQFGGVAGKKFKTRQLEEFILSINDCDMQTQKRKLGQALDDWRGNLEQVDDVCIIGVRV
jgi:serine phosphatase RsbU (regulator of sigma subunit)